MSEISDLTYNVVAFSEIMQMIWKRLNDHGKNYRHVYKALVLLDYLVKTGNEKVAQQCKENIFAIHTLRVWNYCEIYSLWLNRLAFFVHPFTPFRPYTHYVFFAGFPVLRRRQRPRHQRTWKVKAAGSPSQGRRTVKERTSESAKSTRTFCSADDRIRDRIRFECNKVYSHSFHFPLPLFFFPTTVCSKNTIFYDSDHV